MSQSFRARGVGALGNSLLLLLQVLDSLLAQYGTVENCEQGKTGSRDEGVCKDLDCISIKLFCDQIQWEDPDRVGVREIMLDTRPQHVPCCVCNHGTGLLCGRLCWSGWP